MGLFCELSNLWIVYLLQTMGNSGMVRRVVYNQVGGGQYGNMALMQNGPTGARGGYAMAANSATMMSMRPGDMDMYGRGNTAFHFFLFLLVADIAPRFKVIASVCS